MSSPRYTVRLLEEAAAEVRQAVRWYRRASPGVDKEFLATFKRAVGAIRQNPNAHPQVLGTARRVLLRKFPYAVYYAVFGTNILILACYHTRRDPATLKDRL